MNDTNNNRPRADGEPEVPPVLVVALRQLRLPRTFVPPSVDVAVLKSARQHLARPRQTRGWLRPWLFWPALATACIVLMLFVPGINRRSPAPDFPREDLNHDGRVDILDAFQLARQLQSGAKLAPGFDLNGDGAVDRHDAEVIAAHAVKLEKGKRS